MRNHALRLAQFEDTLFYQDAISEATIHEDMKYRVAKQRLSADSSDIEKKKQFYTENFSAFRDELTQIRTQIWDDVLINKCERCIAQIDKLMSIINSYY